MKASTAREFILKAKTKTTPVDIPDWGPSGTFFIKPLKFKDQREIAAQVKADSDFNTQSDLISRYIILSLCDKNGDVVLNDDDTGLVESQPGPVLAVLMKAINKLNGFEEAGPVEAAVKNS